MNSRNPTLTRPITPSTRATISRGRWRLKSVTPKVHTESIRIHSSIDPSCPPHTPAILYCSGSAELELEAT
jgi:hypothetical protein